MLSVFFSSLFLFYHCHHCCAAVTNPILRSRDFGNPQCRQRVYIFGARSDITSLSRFRAMLHYFQVTLRSMHQQHGINDVVKWVSKLRKRHGDLLHAPIKSQEGVLGWTGLWCSVRSHAFPCRCCPPYTVASWFPRLIVFVYTRVVRFRSQSHITAYSQRASRGGELET